MDDSGSQERARPGCRSPAGEASFVVEIDVPAGVADSELVSRVCELVSLADDYHRALGGHGLKVDEVSIVDMS